MSVKAELQKAVELMVSEKNKFLELEQTLIEFCEIPEVWLAGKINQYDEELGGIYDKFINDFEKDKKLKNLSKLGFSIEHVFQAIITNAWNSEGLIKALLEEYKKEKEA